MDWFFMSPDHYPDHEVHFPSRSLAGQEPGYSDRKKDVARDVGRIEPSPDLLSIRMRHFGESDLRGRRAMCWERRVNSCLENKEMQREDSYINWMAGAPEVDANIVVSKAASVGVSAVSQEDEEEVVPGVEDSGVSAVPAAMLEWRDRMLSGTSAMAKAQRPIALQDEMDRRGGRSAALQAYMQQREDARWHGPKAMDHLLEWRMPPPPEPIVLDLTRVPVTPPLEPPPQTPAAEAPQTPPAKAPQAPRAKAQAVSAPPMKAAPQQPGIPPMPQRPPPRRPAPTRGDEPPAKKATPPLPFPLMPRVSKVHSPRGSIKLMYEF